MQYGLKGRDLLAHIFCVILVLLLELRHHMFLCH